VLLIPDLNDLDPTGMRFVRGNCSSAMSIGTLNVQAVAVVAAVDVPRPFLSEETDADNSWPAKIGPEQTFSHFGD
jgi:hypothetical protein